MKSISFKKYTTSLPVFFRNFSEFFRQNYPLFLIGFILVLVTVWAGIFYQKAYRSIIDTPEGTYKRITIPEESIVEVRDEIERREALFLNSVRENHKDPF